MKQLKNNDAYSELGQYIIAFQKIPFILQGTIHLILHKNGLKKDFGEKHKEDIISRIILAERSFFHLLSIYGSLIKELFGENSNDYLVVKKLFDFIKNHVETKRNDIVHSFMSVDEDDIDNLRICREKFHYGTGFKVLSDKEIPQHLLENQIKVISMIHDILRYIYLNLEKNYKITGDILNVNISQKFIDKSLKDIQKYV